MCTAGRGTTRRPWPYSSPAGRSSARLTMRGLRWRRGLRSFVPGWRKEPGAGGVDGRQGAHYHSHRVLRDGGGQGQCEVRSSLECFSVTGSLLSREWQSFARVYYSSQDSNTVRFLINKEMGIAKTDADKEKKKAWLKSFELMVKYCETNVLQARSFQQVLWGQLVLRW